MITRIGIEETGETGETGTGTEIGDPEDIVMTDSENDDGGTARTRTKVPVRICICSKSSINESEKSNRQYNVS